MQRDAPTSLYAQIAAALREDIAAARFEPSGRLPSEEALRARFGVSRVTVRLALAELECEGLVDRRKAKGTFTRGKQVRHALDTLRSFHESLKLQGFRAEISLIKAALDTDADAASLGFRVERLHLADGKPIAVGVSRLPSGLKDLDWDELANQPLYAVFEARLGVVLQRAEFAVGVGVADPAIADLLGVRAGQPLLTLERSSFDAEGRCVDRSTFHVRPERYQFTISSRY
ncbi:GntR family transcriptional regulator [Phenylobacterium sp. LjRoot225]|uniref:GntR family transcriptional regulator n=1 Tax=Phenylobacterium sp. LjRoot225 TaxID=3342285 RepID=UPI003ECFC920